jgi:hypothetical protein
LSQSIQLIHPLPQVGLTGAPRLGTILADDFTSKFSLALLRATVCKRDMGVLDLYRMAT